MIYNVATNKNELTSEVFEILSKFGKINFDLFQFKNYLLIEWDIPEVTFDGGIKFNAINGEWIKA